MNMAPPPSMEEVDAEWQYELQDHNLLYQLPPRPELPVCLYGGYLDQQLVRPEMRYASMVGFIQVHCDRGFYINSIPWYGWAPTEFCMVGFDFIPRNVAVLSGQGLYVGTAAYLLHDPVHLFVAKPLQEVALRTFVSDPSFVPAPRIRRGLGHLAKSPCGSAFKAEPSENSPTTYARPAMSQLAIIPPVLCRCPTSSRTRVAYETFRPDPLRECFQMPKTPSTGLTWTISIFERFANAINRCSHKVINKFGEPAGGFPAICYVGPNDACYLVSQSTKSLSLIAALTIHKSSWWWPSIRATRLSSCPLETRKQDSSVCLRRQNVAISSLHHLMPAKSNHALVTVHTSGSTDFLKPITVRQGM
ncbi:acetyl-CoA synthetase-like protein [Apiospora marii]|uniref:acetyl-CoA synthetase-like protein n=1 Tax=Apiospora marii TaxID=335849 RepID=UPI00312D5CA9